MPYCHNFRDTQSAFSDLMAYIYTIYYNFCDIVFVLFGLVIANNHNYMC